MQRSLLADSWPGWAWMSNFSADTSGSTKASSSLSASIKEAAMVVRPQCVVKVGVAGLHIGLDTLCARVWNSCCNVSGFRRTVDCQGNLAECHVPGWDLPMFGSWILFTGGASPEPKLRDVTRAISAVKDIVVARALAFQVWLCFIAQVLVFTTRPVVTCKLTCLMQPQLVITMIYPADARVKPLEGCIKCNERGIPMDGTLSC